MLLRITLTEKSIDYTKVLVLQMMCTLGTGKDSTWLNVSFYFEIPL